MKSQAPSTAFSVVFRLIAGVVLVFDAVLLYAVVRAAAGGFRPLGHSAVAVSGILMLGLAVYLLIAAPREAAARDLAAVLLLAFPFVLGTASWVPILFYHAGLSGALVALADIGGAEVERALTFLMSDGYYYVSALTPLPFLHLAVHFPRPLTAADIAVPRRGGGFVRRLSRPFRTGLTWLKRALLIRPLLFAAGVTPLGVAIAGSQSATSAVGVVVVFVALSFLRDGYAVSEPAERRRVLWVLGGLFMMVISLSAFVLGWGVLYSWTPRFVREGLQWLAWITPPLAFGLIAAGVLYRGAFDPGLVIRRTTVYGALGVLLTMLFAVVEEVTAERLFQQAGLPDSLGAALAAVVVVAIFRPVRDRLSALYNAFLREGAHDSHDSKDGARLSVVVAELGQPAPDTGVEGLSASVLLRRCARRVAADEGGSVHTAADGFVALGFPDAARAVAGCVALRGRLAASVDLLGARELRPAFAVYQPEPGEERGPDEALEAARDLVAVAEPGEVVLSAGVAAEPGVIRSRRLEPAGEGSGGLLRLAEEESTHPAVASTMTAAAPVLAGVAIVVAAPLVLGSGPEPATSQPGVGLAFAESDDSLFKAGLELSRDEALALEARLKDQPDDLTAHGLLLQYWCSQRWMSIGKWRGYLHALWMLENRPAHSAARVAAYCVWTPGPALEKARDIMLEHVEGPDPAPRELAIAGLLLARGEKEIDRAGRLLGRATDADPRDWRLWQHRGFYFRAFAGHPDSAAVAFTNAAKLLPRRKRGVWLAAALSSAHRAGLLQEFRSHAVELSNIAHEFAGDTSVAAGEYHNVAESAFGLLALESGDVTKAVDHLNAAATPPAGGEPPGRPSLALAAALWDRGVRGPVVDYLEWWVAVADDGRLKDRMTGYLRRAREGKDPGFQWYEKTL